MSIIAGAILFLAVPSAPAIAPQDADPSKIVCKSQKATGSRLSKKRICRTRAEWDEIASTKADSEGRTFFRMGSETAEGAGPGYQIPK